MGPEVDRFVGGGESINDFLVLYRAIKREPHRRPRFCQRTTYRVILLLDECVDARVKALFEGKRDPLAGAPRIEDRYAQAFKIFYVARYHGRFVLKGSCGN